MSTARLELLRSKLFENKITFKEYEFLIAADKKGHAMNQSFASTRSRSRSQSTDNIKNKTDTKDNTANRTDRSKSSKERSKSNECSAGRSKTHFRKYHRGGGDSAETVFLGSFSASEADANVDAEATVSGVSHSPSTTCTSTSTSHSKTQFLNISDKLDISELDEWVVDSGIGLGWDDSHASFHVAHDNQPLRPAAPAAVVVAVATKMTATERRAVGCTGTDSDTCSSTDSSSDSDGDSDMVLDKNGDGGDDSSESGGGYSI
jgi:hypothetical protein